MNIKQTNHLDQYRLIIRYRWAKMVLKIGQSGWPKMIEGALYGEYDIIQHYVTILYT